MKCSKCGFDLPEEAMFCGNCGQKIEPTQPEIIDAESEIIEPVAKESVETIDEQPIVEEPVETIEEQPIVEEPVETANEQPIAEEPVDVVVEEPVSSKNVVDDSEVVETQAHSQESLDAKDSKNKTPLIIVGLVAAFALLVIVVIVLSKAFGGGSSNAEEPFDVNKAPFFYEDKGDLYVLYPGDEEGIELIEDFNGNTNQLVALDEDTFYYIEDEELYYKNGKKDPKEIYDDVMDFYISQSGKRIVMASEDNELLLYNGKDVVEITDDFEYFYYVTFSENDKYFAFIGGNEDYEENVYICKGEEYEEIELDEMEVYSILGVSDEYVYFTAFDYESYEEYVCVGDMSGDYDKLFEYNEYDLYYNAEDSTMVYVDYDGKMYYYDGESSDKIEKDVDGLSKVFGAEKETYIVYSDEDAYVWIVGMDDVIDIEDYDDAYDYDWSRDAQVVVLTTGDELLVLELGKDEYKVDEKDIEDVYMVDVHGDGKYAILQDDRNTVYQYKIGKDEPKEVLEDVWEYTTNGDYSELLLVDDDYDVYYYNGKEAVEIGEDYDSQLRFVNDDKGYFFIDDNYSFNYGSRGKEVEEVADDIYYAFSYDSKLIYLIDEDNELLTYKVGNKEAKKLDIDIDDWYPLYIFIPVY